MGRIFNDCERAYFDAVVEDRLCAAGETVNFWSVLDQHTDGLDNVDPFHDALYDEPLSDPISGNERFRFKGPYRLQALVKKGDKQEAGSERGSEHERTDGVAVFARVAFEREEIPPPKKGDVIEWDGRHYDMVLVAQKGNVADTLTFTEYRCELKINRKFAPERRVDAVDVIAP